MEDKEQTIHNEVSNPQPLAQYAIYPISRFLNEKIYHIMSGCTSQKNGQKQQSSDEWLWPLIAGWMNHNLYTVAQWEPTAPLASLLLSVIAIKWWREGFIPSLDLLPIADI